MNSANAPQLTDIEDRATREFIALGTTPGSRLAREHTAAAFTRQFTDLAGWSNAGASRQVTAPVDVRGFVARLLVMTAHPAGAYYAVASRSSWGAHSAVIHAAFFEHFTHTALGIGFRDIQVRQQWNTLAQAAAAAGAAPNMLASTVFEGIITELTGIRHAGRTKIPNSWSTPVHGLKATMAVLGLLDSAPPVRLSPSRRSIHWNHLAIAQPLLIATLRRYLSQIGISMRPASIALIDTTLRHLAVYLTAHHPDVTAVAGIRRTHIEGFKTFLASKSGYRGSTQPAKTTLGMRLGHLRGFFDRIIEWGYDDAPARNPVYSGDMPLRDRPLPRFLGDADAAALLASARRLPSLFDRVAVEVLSLTGLRKGEFLGLTRGAVTDINGARWLRTPIGKLHTDRYIPLHPRVDELLSQWCSENPPQPRSDLMFTDLGRPIPGRRVDYAVYAAADDAGIGHVTLHQLRHTLATQAINRGMSLEAIAALLGHQSLSMTMTYARIADGTVAEEYFAVTEHLDAIYTPEPTAQALTEGPNMARLRTESSRLRGNGNCTRPTLLDCNYETICETCTHFSTNESHRTRLTDQAADAASRSEPRREKVYLELLTTLDNRAPHPRSPA
ncbi:MAG: site-specific integrase [Rhodococcus sp. (in: high G+C Gram-positive bacteria)]